MGRSPELATDANGVRPFTKLPMAFYSLKQDNGYLVQGEGRAGCSQSRLIVDGGQNTDVFIYSARR